MELSIKPERNHWKPILIVWLGTLPDEFEKKREAKIKRVIKTPVRIAFFCGDKVHKAYNESINFCMESKVIKYVIFVNKNIYPKKDWSAMVRGMTYKRHSLVTHGNDFFIININKVRKFGLYQTKSGVGELLKWLNEKSKSDGHKVRAVNEEELKSIGDFNDTDKR